MKRCKTFQKIRIYFLRANRKFTKLDQRGQALIEFLLLLFTLISLSIVLLGGTNKFIGKRWQAMIKVIASPPSQSIDFN